MTGLSLVAVGKLPSGLLQDLARFLEGRIGENCSVSNVILDPSPVFDPKRRQYESRKLLASLDSLGTRNGGKVLGVADVDLYSAIFTFVIGEATLAGISGIFSLHRLRPSVYGLPEDMELAVARARKEALHETGHLLGLVHCRAPDCVMRFSGEAREVDLKSDQFCGICAGRLGAGSGRLR